MVSRLFKVSLIYLSYYICYHWYFFISAIPDEKTSHIHSMVINQRNSNNKTMKNVNSMLHRNRSQYQHYETNGAKNRFQDHNIYYKVFRKLKTDIYVFRISNLFFVFYKFIQKPQQPNFSQATETTKPDSGSESYLTFIMMHLKDLLQPYPDGVEMKWVCDMFTRKFNHTMNIKKLGFQSVSELFEKQSDSFSVWEVNDSSFVRLKQYDESLDCTSEESFKSYSHCRPEPRQLQLLDEKKVNIYQDSPHGPELLSVFQPSISINPVQKIQDCSPAIAFNNSIAKLTQSLSRHSIRSVPTHWSQNNQFDKITNNRIIIHRKGSNEIEI